jgi:hypothetical protein
MSPCDEKPWFHAAVQLLDVRRQDRLLALYCDPRQTRDLATLVGGRGELIVLMPDREMAQSVAEQGWPQVSVLAHEVKGNESFGSFDAMLVAPTTGPLLPSGAFAELSLRNLRPGGRLVVDVPGPDMVPDLCLAWQQLDWPRSRYEPLLGIGDDTLAGILRSAGLRGVHGVLGAHLLHPATPADLVDAFAPSFALTDVERVELTHALVRCRGGHGPFDVLVHRTRLQALR